MNVKRKTIITTMLLLLVLPPASVYAAKETNPSVRSQIRDLQEQIDRLSVASNVVLVKDANGVYIGRVIGMEFASVPYVLTDEGYRTSIKSNGTIHLNYNSFSIPMNFESTNCTGVGYHLQFGHKGTVYGTIVNPGQADEDRVIRYTEHKAELTSIIMNSMMNRDSQCEVTNGEVFEGYPAYINDPSVTGISNADYPARLIIE